jgi:hypothetical protein
LPERPAFRLREQFTASDCFPTSVLNALGLLFPRSDLPPEVLQRVYLYTLDGVDRGQSRCRWTSGEAALFLAEWLCCFRTRRFAVEARYVEGGEVHLRPRNVIGRWLAAGGKAVIDVLTRGGYAHSVALLGLDARWAYVWDPFYRAVPRSLRGDAAVERLPSDGRSANFRIRRDHFASTAGRPFSLGPKTGRSCLLLRRIAAAPGR